MDVMTAAVDNMIRNAAAMIEMTVRAAMTAAFSIVRAMKYQAGSETTMPTVIVTATIVRNRMGASGANEVKAASSKIRAFATTGIAVRTPGALGAARDLTSITSVRRWDRISIEASRSASLS